MTAMKWKEAAVLLALALGGCGSSPPVTFYDLEALETSQAAGAGIDLTVGVGPLRIPDYLTRPQIVTRRSDGTVVIDDFNRWVEPVDDAIHRIVAENLDNLIEDAAVVAFPFAHVAKLDYQIIGRISRFEADDTGTAALELQWGIISGTEEFLLQPTRTRYEARASGSQDYTALARAMSEVLQQFSRDVAQTLEALMRPADD